MRVEGSPSSRRPRHPLSESDRFDWSPYSPSRAFGFGELVEELGRGRAEGCSVEGGAEGSGGGVLRCAAEGEGSMPEGERSAAGLSALGAEGRRGGGFCGSGAEGSKGFHHV